MNLHDTFVNITFWETILHFGYIVQSRHHYHLVKCNLFSPWYCSLRVFFCFLRCMLSSEARRTNFIVFDLTPLGLKSHKLLHSRQARWPLHHRRGSVKLFTTPNINGGSIKKKQVLVIYLFVDLLNSSFIILTENIFNIVFSVLFIWEAIVVVIGW
jgi:hypothetical protein